MTSFGKGFDDDVQVYVDRYPHLDQAHRLSANSEQIDAEAFELALTAFLDGLDALYASVCQ